MCIIFNEQLFFPIPPIASLINVTEGTCKEDVKNSIIKKNVRITPELHAKWLYDFAGDARRITASFAGGGASFVTQGVDPARSSGSIGAKLTIMTPTSWSVSPTYDFETKPDFYGHHGWISLRYEF